MSRDLEVKVRTKLIEKGMQLSELAEILGISAPYLSDLLKGNRSGEKAQEHIRKIRKILNIK